MVHLCIICNIKTKLTLHYHDQQTRSPGRWRYLLAAGCAGDATLGTPAADVSLFDGETGSLLGDEGACSWVGCVTDTDFFFLLKEGGGRKAREALAGGRLRWR